MGWIFMTFTSQAKQVKVKHDKVVVLDYSEGFSSAVSSTFADSFVQAKTLLTRFAVECVWVEERKQINLINVTH